MFFAQPDHLDAFKESSTGAVWNDVFEVSWLYTADLDGIGIWIRRWYQPAEGRLGAAILCWKGKSIMETSPPWASFCWDIETNTANTPIALS